MKLESLSWPVRWESSLLIFVGLICNYAMRLNISIAIIKVDTESEKVWKNCLQMSESKTTPLWPLHNYSPISWNTEDRALVLSAFFYGYIAFQVPSFPINFLDIFPRCRAVEWPRYMGLRKCLAIGLWHCSWPGSIPITNQHVAD